VYFHVYHTQLTHRRDNITLRSKSQELTMRSKPPLFDITPAANCDMSGAAMEYVGDSDVDIVTWLAVGSVTWPDVGNVIWLDVGSVTQLD